MKRKIKKLTVVEFEVDCDEAYCGECSHQEPEGGYNNEDVAEQYCKVYGRVISYNNSSKEPIRLQDCVADEVPNGN